MTQVHEQLAYALVSLDQAFSGRGGRGLDNLSITVTQSEESERHDGLGNMKVNILSCQ